MKQSAKSYRRIVIKIGSSLFCNNGALDMCCLDALVADIAWLVKTAEKEVVIVSSGAIALGMDAMKLESRPKDIASLQAAAAIGQNLLMDNYSGAFKKFKMITAQVLLTWDDFNSRQRYLNAKNTILSLLKLSAIPVINENDTISTDEIKFGDNDRLSALVATLINADLLVIFSDVDGLLDQNKKLVKFVDAITPEIKALAAPTHKKTCVGGMVTKIEAAKICVDSGIPCVITDGRKKNIITNIIKDPAASGEWTLFLPKKSSLVERERWIAFSAKAKGKIIVDEGAKNALLNKKSLLSVGVLDSQGVFETGDVISITDKSGREFAKGRAGVSSRQLEKVKGKRSEKEVVHSDNLVIL